jgi:predicted dehydrogenase
MERKMKLKFGIIGYGRIAKKTMIPALELSNYAELEMIGSRTPENREGFGTYEEVLANKKIEVVYISLPIGLHEEWAIKAAKAGKNILCEKSFTYSFDSAKRMLDVCKENNVRIMEGFMFKYHPQHSYVKQLIKKNTLGDLLTFKGSFGSPFWDETDMRMDKSLGSGILNDIACYPVCASRMIFNEEPESVFCNLKKDPKLGNLDIKADILLNYSKGKTAFCSSSFNAAYQSTYDVWGTKSFLSVKRAYAVPEVMPTSIYLLNEKDEMEETIINPANQTRLMVDKFCKTILREEEIDFESDLLAQARVMESIRLSDKEKRVVKISELNL